MLNEKNKGYIKSKWRIQTIQESMPQAKLYESGMFEFKKSHLYSATYRIKDVDFTSGSDEDQEDFFLNYSDILTSLDGRNSTYKITLLNRNTDYMKNDFRLLPTDVEDQYNAFRSEINSMRRRNRAKASGLIQERYITMTTEKKNAELAEKTFERFGKDFSKRLQLVGSGIEQLSAEQRVELFYDFYQPGMEEYYSWNYADAERKHTTWKDYACPTYLKFNHFDFDMGKDKVGRVLFLRDWGGNLKVELLSRLMELKTVMMVSVDIIPLTAEAQHRFMENAEMSSEVNLDRWQRRPGAERRIWSAPPLRIKKDQQIVATYSEDVNERNQKIFYANVSIVVLADSIEQLDSYTDSLVETANECGGAQIQVKGFEQMDALNTVLPYGPRYVQNLRDVTTENAAAMMPFNSVMINHINGIPYGVHGDTKQEVLIDRRELPNGNEWILGSSGGGKSMLNKILTIYEALITPGDILFVDPHGEYAALTRAMGGEVITLGGNSKDVINVMDMCRGYGDGDDLKQKMKLLVAVFHAALGLDFTKSMEALVIRCSQHVYQSYVTSGFMGDPPTLQDLYEDIRSQPEEVAQDLALLMESMLIGPMACFNGYSNVDLFKRITCFDISQMDQAVWDAGMTVIMDALQNRLVMNFNPDSTTPTYIKIDEVGRFLNDPYLSRIFERFYSECRKFGGYITGIIQNINKLMHIEAAKNMLSNSEIVVMFRQSQIDAEVLKTLFDLSKIQKETLMNAEPGCGLIKCGTSFFNFDARIEPGYIYDLANTKPKFDF
ncbi:MAG: ATP-binding protein [Eubacterium sp.]|nr:ATP-binding protein [Eubacterium sp.]